MNEQERQNTFKEAKILSSLNHQNIITYHEQYKTKKNRLCIVMDYAEGKILKKYAYINTKKAEISLK